MEKRVSKREPRDLGDIKRSFAMSLLDTIENFDKKSHLTQSAKVFVIMDVLGDILIKLAVDFQKSNGEAKHQIEFSLDFMLKHLDDVATEYIKEVFEGKQSDE